MHLLELLEPRRQSGPES